MTPRELYAALCEKDVRVHIEEEREYDELLAAFSSHDISLSDGIRQNGYRPLEFPYLFIGDFEWLHGDRANYGAQIIPANEALEILGAGVVQPIEAADLL